MSAPRRRSLTRGGTCGVLKLCTAAVPACASAKPPNVGAAVQTAWGGGGGFGTIVPYAGSDEDLAASLSCSRVPEDAFCPRMASSSATPVATWAGSELLGPVGVSSARTAPKSPSKSPTSCSSGCPPMSSQFSQSSFWISTATSLSPRPVTVSWSWMSLDSKTSIRSSIIFLPARDSAARL